MGRMPLQRRLMSSATLAAIAFNLPVAQALDFEYGELTGSWKSTLSFSGALRTEKADARLLGKLSLNPDLCPDGCLSFTGDPEPNQRLVDAPGAFLGTNKDDGSLNYGQWDPTAAIVKLSTEVAGNYGDWSFKLGAIGFFDPVNYRFTETNADTTFQPRNEGRPHRRGHPIGQEIQIRDAFVSRPFVLMEHEYSLTVGWQRYRWGESTYVALNSLSELQPPDARLLRHPGTPISEVFRSTPLIALNTSIGEGMSLDFVYQMAWRPVVVDPGGAFNSDIDFYNNDNFNISIGQFHDDPLRLQRIPFPINAISNSSFTGEVLPLKFARPNNQGQVGGKFTWYLPDFNGGTELGFYALNYHSRLPYFSVISTDESCARDAAGFVEAFTACDGFVGLNPETGGEPAPIDTQKVFFAYPENIQMIGMSFNTNVGKWSMAGEYSFRPNLPLQVSAVDVFFAGLQPSLPRQDITLGVTPEFIAQSIASITGSIGDIATSNPQQLLGQVTALLNGLPVLLPAAASGVTLPSSRNAVPDFLSGYRGIEIGPNQRINGFERFPVQQLDITGIRALGSSENPFGADQVIILVEVGMTHVIGMPSRGRLQLEGGDNNNTHASPGADGTGRPGGVPDTRSLVPTQQTSGFADSFSTGYRILTRFEYNNVFAGINVKPELLFGHDVYGISPQPIQNFVEDRITYQASAVFENGGPWTGQLVYQGSTGGGTVNTQRDRDIVGFQVGYTF
jgi:hypothetical protein